MGFSATLGKHRSLIALPFWACILVWPLTGFAAAVKIGLAVLGVRVLWTAGTTGRARVFWRTIVAGTWRRNLSPRVAPIASFLKSPTALVVLVVLLFLLPLTLNNYYRDIMTLTGLYIVLALGLNLIVGQAGLLHLGYVSSYAIGAYTYAILSTSFGLSFWPGLLVGAGVAAVIAALLGLPILRLRGDYFAIVTLGLGEITRIVLNNWDQLTNGPNGIADIPRPVVFGHVLSRTVDFTYLILCIAILTVIAMHRLMHSRIGRAWIAIREDEIAAEAMGIDTFRLKLLAFVLGSAWAGLAGVFFAAKMAFVSPESFTFFESVMILCMVVLGGMGSIPGIILGAILLITLPEVFREFQDYRMFAFGAALVLMMIFRPQGLLGSAKRTG